MKSVFILATLLSVSCLSQEQNLPELKETSIEAYPGYELIWNEEFETDGRPNDQEWTYEYGFQRNRELQWYQEENAFCEGGKLIIEGRKELKPNPHYKEGNGNWKEKRKYISYTSACLTSKQSWQYGRFEIKAKIKELQFEKKELKAELKRIFKEEKLEKKKQNVSTLNSDLIALTGWLLGFYLFYYFINYYLSFKSSFLQIEIA